MSDVIVLGAGAWGTALAIQAARSGARVALWARDPRRAALIERARGNPRLPDAPLPAGVCVVTAPTPAPIALLAVPVAYLRELRVASPMLVACCKGLEPGTARLPLEIVAETHPDARAGVLSGPNFAHEVAAGLPAASVVASLDAGLRDRVAEMIGSPTFRLYGNLDPVGVQVGGAAKNVVAIAAGVVAGAGLGENARAALIARGLGELARLVVALGGQAETAQGLSGLGDLVLTCTGGASRNYSLGVDLGRGETAASALAMRTVAIEGVNAAPALIARAPSIDLPICRAVALLLAGEITAAQAIAGLLARPRRDE